MISPLTVGLAAEIALLPLAVTIPAGTFWASGCNPWHVIRGWLGGPQDLHGCSTIALSLDVPSLILWIGTITAVLLFDVQRSAMKRLASDLVESGISGSAPPAFRYVDRGRAEIITAAVVFVGMIFVGILLHSHVAKDFGYRDYLHSTYRSSGTATWWAQSAPASWVWMLIGIIGATTATMHALMNAQFTKMVWQARRDPDLEFQFVPAWMSDSHGWEPLRTMWYCVIAGSVIFLASFGAVSYLVVGGATSQPTLTLIFVLFLSGGFAVNTVMINLIYASVRGWFTTSVAAERRSLASTIQRLKSGKRADQNVQLVAAQLEAHEMKTVPNFPFSNRWKLVPAAAAFLITNFAVIGTIFSWASGSP